ncbi:nucleotide exchange factor GrpE [Hathewaya massiliensis]|uniref:nucleotide exchange factor GrpE n=1 Tax=Hathewaya massiliensis TaxID=1964382 RepID=UPI00115BF16B
MQSYEWRNEVLVKNNTEEKITREDKDHTVENMETSCDAETQCECGCEEECVEKCADKEETTEDKLKKELDKLKLENTTLKDENKFSLNKIKTLEERYSNLASEYENYRKRTAKEKEDIYTNSCADILKEFLPVLDNLERAIEAQGSLEELKTGVEMTLKGFKGAFEKLDVEEISTSEGFDPNCHNAVMHIEDSQYGESEIVEVFQKGYKREDKVIRYSMVKVAN